MVTFQRLCKMYRSSFDHGDWSSIMQDFLQMVMSDGMCINNDQTNTEVAGKMILICLPKKESVSELI